MKMKRIPPIYILFFLSAFNCNLFSQAGNSYVIVPVGLGEYLTGVAKGNLGYIAARFNVSIAEAAQRAARVFPDPDLSFSYSNNEDNKLQMGQSYDAGLSYRIKTGNVRKAGIEKAGTETDLSRLILESYFRNLRADAAKSYYASLRNLHILNLQKETLLQLNRIASADSIRLRAGEATELNAIQTSLEASLQLHNVLESQSYLENSQVTLSVLQGRNVRDSLLMPEDDFPSDNREFLLFQLLDSALSRRTEVMVALTATELQRKNFNLLKADRAFEFSIEAGYSYSTIVKNEIAPAPAFNAVSTGLSFPLKFSNLNKGELNAAEYAVSQSKTYEKEAELQIKAEVMTAFNNYLACRKKVESFNSQMTENAEKILNGRIKAYQTGESGLIELLNARRTYTELRMHQIESLFEYTAALIDLERAAGIWDLSE